jgi:hypothetical protein
MDSLVSVPVGASDFQVVLLIVCLILSGCAAALVFGLFVIRIAKEIRGEGNGTGSEETKEPLT